MDKMREIPKNLEIIFYQWLTQPKKTRQIQ
jgi:hypothetical protein